MHVSKNDFFEGINLHLTNKPKGILIVRRWNEMGKLKECDDDTFYNASIDFLIEALSQDCIEECQKQLPTNTEDNFDKQVTGLRNAYFLTLMNFPQIE